MKVKKFIDPFSSQVHEMAKKFDMATIENRIEDISKLLVEAESLLDTQNRASQAQLYYSMGTVYSDFSKKIETAETDPQKKCLYYFRRSIELIENDECGKDIYKPYVDAFRAILYTNYGNLLDRCGRKIAAIEQYKKALAINKNFGMAIGNLGMAYRHYGMLEYDYIHRDYFHHFAYWLLYNAVESKDPNTHIEAKRYFQQAIDGYDQDYIEKVLKPSLDIPKFSYEDIDELAYREWVLENGLFLNTLNDLPVSELFFAADTIYLPDMVTHIGDKPIFHGMFNQIKQEYIFARYLYYCAMLPQEETHFADKETYLVNFADYPQYSIRVEQLKAAYKTLYGLFDKMAYFINSYFKLGIREKDVSFRSIWKKEHGKGKYKYEYQNVLNSDENFALASLYWISKDFFEKYEDSPNPCLKRLSDIRNALEHKYVKITLGMFSERIDGDIDDLALYVSETEMYDITLKLLKIIREAILCLCLCVNIEEQKKKQNLDDINAVMSIQLMEYDDEWKI